MKKITFFTALFIAFSSFAQVPNYVSTNGLVGWWPFNGNANDESGNGNNGTVGGATLTTDRNGNSNQAYNFNSNYIEVLSSPTLNITQGTINFWAVSSSNTVMYPIKKNNYVGAVNSQLSIAFNTSNLLSLKYNSNCQAGVGWSQFGGSNPTLTNGSWHMVTTTFASTVKVYIDGVLITTSTPPNNNVDNCTGDLQFGREWSTNPNYFIGKLDDIGIWNRALTQQEITNLYNGVYNLPVELTQFSASCSENTTNINWQTATEHNSAYFEVLKSRDGENWNSLATVDAAGNSFEAINYSIKDDIDATTVYYKLNQVDKDGKSQEYGPISANCNENTSLFITPNPTNGEFNLIGMEHFGTITSLEVKDATGKVVKVLDPTTSKFSCVGLKTGIYFLNSTSGSKQEVVKIIKE